MSTRAIRRSDRWSMLPLTLVVAIVLSLASTTSAADPRVRDSGRFFSPATVEAVERQLEDLHRQTGRQVIVETYERPPMAIGSSVDMQNTDARAAVFGEFAADRAKQIGADVYVLVNRTPSHLRVFELNELKQAGLPQAQRERVVQTMLVAFKDKQFDQGLTSGVAMLTGSLAAGPPAGAATPNAANEGGARGPAAAAPSASRDFEPKGSSSGASPEGETGNGSGGLGIFGWILLIGGVFIAFRLIRSLFGNRQQNTPYGQSEPMNPQQGPGGMYGEQGGPYGQQPGGFGGGGGFGRGMMGGVLGGVLGSMIGSRIGHGQTPTQDPNASAGGADADPEINRNSGYSGSGGDFDSGGGGGDFGGGDSGGGDF
ncbi:MAG TPA: TPM domain-containing protein [Tepidisphaeraceae bacterium]|jgi:hypothetical protein|nr:TPM domain-containing protein [Tepidisphaeraceae bacterium]